MLVMMGEPHDDSPLYSKTLALQVSPTCAFLGPVRDPRPRLDPVKVMPEERSIVAKIDAKR